MSPLISQQYPDAAGRQRVTAAIEAVNAGLKAMADRHGVVLVSSSTVTEAGLERFDENGMLRVGDLAVDIARRGNAPGHLQLDDNAGHAGTIASGLLANAWFIEPVNAAFGTSIAPFSDAEVLETAGIRR